MGEGIKDFGNRHAYSSFDDVGFKRFDGGIKVGCGVQYDYLYSLTPNDTRPYASKRLTLHWSFL